MAPYNLFLRDSCLSEVGTIQRLTGEKDPEPSLE